MKCTFQRKVAIEVASLSKKICLCRRTVTAVDARRDSISRPVRLQQGKTGLMCRAVLLSGTRHATEGYLDGNRMPVRLQQDQPGPLC